MPLPPTVSCFSKIQIGFTFLVPAHLGSPGKRAIKRMCVCVCMMLLLLSSAFTGRMSSVIQWQRHQLNAELMTVHFAAETFNV